MRERHGAESVAFYRGASGGSASAEYEPWLIRFASLLGSPNTVSTGHICSWHKDNGSRYTYGTGIPNPDFENTACILLWGAQPQRLVADPGPSGSPLPGSAAPSSSLSIPGPSP